MTYFFHAATLAALGFVLFQLSYLGRCLMSTQEAVDKVTATLNKVLGEVTSAKDVLVAKMTELQAQLDAAGVAEQIDLSGLQSVAAALDDLNPDVVEEVPAEEPADAPADEPTDAPAEETQDAPPF